MVASSESLHVLQQVPFLIAGEVHAPKVTLVPIALQVGVVKRPNLYGFVAAGDEAHVFLVVYVVAAVELLGPLFGIAEKVPHGGYRAVVQIGCTRPCAVERLIRITVCLLEMRDALRRFGIESPLESLPMRTDYG